MTSAARAHELPVTLFVASVARVAAGQLWVLATSALVVDRPVLVGFAAFVSLAALTMWYCGARTFWIAAIAGHLGSTLIVYAIVGLSRLVDTHLFGSAFVAPDFGVSAMQGAWVGALATTAWFQTGRGRGCRAAVIAGVCVLAAVAWWLHPDPSILTTEHGFAFLIGCVVVIWPRMSRRARGGSTRFSRR